MFLKAACATGFLHCLSLNCQQPLIRPWMGHRLRGPWCLICQPRPRDCMISALPSRNNISGCSVPCPAPDSLGWPGLPGSRHFDLPGARQHWVSVEDSGIPGLLGSWLLPLSEIRTGKAGPSTPAAPGSQPPYLSGRELVTGLWRGAACIPSLPRTYQLGDPGPSHGLPSGVRVPVRQRGPGEFSGGKSPAHGRGRASAGCCCGSRIRTEPTRRNASLCPPWPRAALPSSG